jgi:hypothetical protein
MRDKSFEFISKIKICRCSTVRYPVFHGAVSGVPRCGIRCSTVRYPVFHGAVSGVPRCGIRCSTVRYPVFHGTVSGVPRYGHFPLVKGLSLELQK